MLRRYIILLVILIIAGCGDDDSPSSNSSTGFSLSGQIFVANNTVKDNDVNDVNAPVLSDNNNISNAQSIPNPMILGGYVNKAGAGPNGRFKSAGDPDDFFKVDLRKGQSITLFVANHFSGGDLNLNLLNSNGAISDSSVGGGATENINVPADGRYFIQVQASKGASNYVLSIGQALTKNHQSLHLSDDFVPGDVIVQFKQDAQMTTYGMHTQSFDPSRRMLFKFNQLRTFAADNITFATPELRSKYETLMAIKALREQSNIAEASPNYRLRALATNPNDELYRYQWNLSLMNMPQAWDTTTGDPSVIVAVVDTGVLLNHPDLRNNLVGGYDFIKDANIALDGDGIDSNPDDPGDQSPGGSSFHGTHVAGTVAASTNNNIGIAGVAWATKIMPLRVLGRGGAGTDYDTEQAMRFAAGLANDSGTVPARRADIINFSLGGPAISGSFQQLINDVRNAGVIVVAAAGNENTEAPMYPASLNGVVSVSAVNINKQRASYSNFGPHVDVAAPGGDNTPDINGDGRPDSILSTMGEERANIEFTYRSLMGTSMATPHIAGVISLMKTANPNLTPPNFDDLLKSGKITEDLGTNGRDDKFGYGLINAQKAVLEASELAGNPSKPAPPQLVATPQSLNFGLSLNSTTLVLSNAGNGNLQIESISENSNGFLSWTGSGLGSYTIKVDRSGLAVGTYTATITIKSNVNTLNVPVILQVGDPNSAGDAGFHYILLVDPNNLEKTIQQASAEVKNGVYSFSFHNVPTGKYIIAAGSDFNNDGYICDDGEACGMYPTSAIFTPIEMTNNRSGIDFNTGFKVNLWSQATTDMKKPPQGFARIRKAHLLAQ